MARPLGKSKGRPASIVIKNGLANTTDSQKIILYRAATNDHSIKHLDLSVEFGVHVIIDFCAIAIQSISNGVVVDRTANGAEDGPSDIFKL